MPLKLLTALPQHSLSYLHQRRFSAHCISGASQPGAAVNREADHRGLATACRNILDYRCRWLTLRSRKISRHVACRYIDRPLCSRDFLKGFRRSRLQRGTVYVSACDVTANFSRTGGARYTCTIIQNITARSCQASMVGLAIHCGSRLRSAADAVG